MVDYFRSIINQSDSYLASLDFHLARGYRRSWLCPYCSRRSWDL